MQKAGVKIRGMEELQRKLKALGADLSSEMGGALVAGAEIVRDDAKRRVPVRTGRLRDSIMVDRVSAEEVRVGPEKKAWYGKFVELGKTGYAPRPFLRPALDEREKNVIRAVKAQLQKAVERHTR